jgi:SAM-dependent methyltransferase
MLANLINAHDLRRLYEKLSSGDWRRWAIGAMRGSKNRTRSAWAHTESPPIHAWQIPALRRRWNKLISGNENTDYPDYVASKFFAGKKGLAAFSPCCGSGGNELRWAATGVFDRIDACDLSEKRIAAARAAAEKSESGAIARFFVSDWRAAPIAAPYDIVIADGALHHMVPMRRALERIRRLLKPDGFLIANDFSGPSRFQWSRRQLQAANALLSLIPDDYRRRWPDGGLKKRIDAPGRLRMRLADPSEAAESSLIRPLLKELFTPLEWREKGGAIACLVFHEIALRYLEPDETAAEIMRLCFAWEDLLMARGCIASDYFLGVFANPARTQ